MELSWNPQDNRQAEDRVHRLGQTRDVRIAYFLSSDTLEEDVLKANIRKMQLDENFGAVEHSLCKMGSGGAGGGPTTAESVEASSSTNSSTGKESSDSAVIVEIDDSEG